MSPILIMVIGLVGGIFSGAFGIGGGAIMVPLLVYLVHLTQHQAQGTILAVLLLPVGILSVIRYYVAGNVKINIAVLVAIGFIFGALLGAHLIHYLPETTLRRLFGVFLILVGIRMAVLR